LVTETELEASLTDLIPALITNASELKTMSEAAKSLAKPNSSAVIASQLLELATGDHS
jgi:UDP-N-acetylglucosamine:LPS N-acetylglucosamine transferase